MVEVACSEEEPYLKWIKKASEEAYSELKKEFKKDVNDLKVFVFKNQKEFQEYIKKNFNHNYGYGSKWLIGCRCKPNEVYIASPTDWPLHRKKRTYSDVKKLIKHEFVHSFINKRIPNFLDEGVAVYFAKQKATKKRIRRKVKQLKHFPPLAEDNNLVYYNLAPFFVKWLVKKYGKNKLINFLNSKGYSKKFFEKSYGRKFEQLENQWKEEEFKGLKKYF